MQKVEGKFDGKKERQMFDHRVNTVFCFFLNVSIKLHFTLTGSLSVSALFFNIQNQARTPIRVCVRVCGGGACMCVRARARVCAYVCVSACVRACVCVRATCGVVRETRGPASESCEYVPANQRTANRLNIVKSSRICANNTDFVRFSADTIFITDRSKNISIETDPGASPSRKAAETAFTLTLLLIPDNGQRF